MSAYDELPERFAKRTKSAVDAYAAAKSELWDLIARVRRSTTLESSEKKATLHRLYAPLSTLDVQTAFHLDTDEYEIGLSFRAQLVQARHDQRYLREHGYKIGIPNNSKIADRQFATLLGIPTPQTLESGIPSSKLELTPGTIIKPTSGASAKGVFYVSQTKTLHSIRTARNYQTFQEAQREVPNRKSKWIVEEAIQDPFGRLANDFKVYMFYGVPAFVLEIQRPTEPGEPVLYAPKKPDGSYIDLGRSFTTFPGSPIPDPLLGYANKISLASPVPFLRIDFHASETNAHLGEITPHPGGVYAGNFHEHIDKILGREFADAKARLTIDLLNGKDFSSYVSTYNT